ncbi:hypothetical protein GOAMR_08_00010, partial [Gordonia amarae NBRC 15530]
MIDYQRGGLVGSVGSVVTDHPQAPGAPTVFTYDRSGRETARRTGVAVTLSRYDRRSQLVAQQASGPSGVVAGRQWDYRADGYVTGIADHLRGGRRFDLDALGRVTATRAARATGPSADRRPGQPGGTTSPVRSMGQVSSGSGEVVESYGYTASGVLAFAAGGGLEREQGVASSPRTGPAQVRGQDKITVRGTVVTGQGRTRYRYDRAGQMVGHRRTRLSRPAETTTFTYTGGG